MSFLIDVFVTPQRRMTGAIGETDALTDSVVALPVGQVDKEIDGFGKQCWCFYAPVRIQVSAQRSHQGKEVVHFEFGPPGNHRMQRHRIADDGSDLRHQPRHCRHHETGRALTVDDGLHFLGSGVFHYSFYSFRVVINCSLIHGPFRRLKINAASPVFQPDVVTVFNQCVDKRGFDRGPEYIGSDTRAMN